MTYTTETAGVQRSLWIDAIRGAALLLICFDHIAQYLPTFRPTLSRSFQLLGIVTMAEVFILTSGAAVAKGYLWRTPPPDPLERRTRLWRRAGRIYFAHLLTLAIILLISSLPGGRLTDLPAGVELRPFISFALGSLLLFQPRLADLLPMYVVFFLVLPWVLDEIERGRARSVVVSSIALWLLAQGFTMSLAIRYYHGVIFPAFNLFAWQLLFVLGLFMVHPAVSQTVSALAPARRRILILALGTAALSFCAARHLVPSIADTGAFWSARPRLGALRMANVITLAGLALALAPSLRSFGPPYLLRVLGRHSLWLWCFNIVTVCLWKRIFEYRYCEWSTAAQFAVCFGTMFAMLPVALSLETGTAWLRRRCES